jgi:hypothetical protein
MLRARRDSFTPAMFEAAGRELGIAQEPVARAIQVLAETVDPANRGGPEVLADHLRQLVAFCRSHGAEPIVLGYPFHTDTTDRIQRDVAAELHATFVPLAPKFDELLRGRDRSELFVADGHCNDAGYAVMAQEVAAALRTRAGAPAAR